MSDQDTRNFLFELEHIIQRRLAAPEQYSYTAKLATEGIERVAQKVGEEAVEVALASVTDPGGAELKNEIADLLYHLLVLLSVRDIPLADITAILASRHEERAALNT